jgi:hypothetical protein
MWCRGGDRMADRRYLDLELPERFMLQIGDDRGNWLEPGST